VVDDVAPANADDLGIAVVHQEAFEPVLGGHGVVIDEADDVTVHGPQACVGGRRLPRLGYGDLVDAVRVARHRQPPIQGLVRVGVGVAQHPASTASRHPHRVSGRR